MYRFATGVNLLVDSQGAQLLVAWQMMEGRRINPNFPDGERPCSSQSCSYKNW
jgi:hypothetical protein